MQINKTRGDIFIFNPDYLGIFNFNIFPDFLD